MTEYLSRGIKCDGCGDKMAEYTLEDEYGHVTYHLCYGCADVIAQDPNTVVRHEIKVTPNR